MRALFDWHGFVQAGEVLVAEKRQMRTLLIKLPSPGQREDKALEGNEEALTVWSVPFRRVAGNETPYYLCAGCWYCDGSMRRRAFEDGKVAGVAEYRRIQRRKIALARRKRREHAQIKRRRRAKR